MSNNNFVFNATPNVYHKRNKFDLSHGVKTSTSMGRLTPFLLEEVLPGDSFSVRTDMVIRLSSPLIKPIMESMFADVYYFYVPNRLLYDKWEDVLAVAEPDEWVNPEDVQVPTFETGSNGGVVVSGSIADYFGLPIGEIPDGMISMLPFRANALIYNQYFRDENLIESCYVQKGENLGDDVEYLNNLPFAPDNYCGMPPQVAKVHDYFTSALPGVQKGEPVTLNVAGFAPLAVGSKISALDGAGIEFEFQDDVLATNLHNLVTQGGSDDSAYTNDLGVIADSSGASGSLNPLVGTNLGVNLSASGSVSVNDLRYAFAIQRILERSARSGSRYTEYLYSAFGVDAGDARLQRAEYLGGKRIPVEITQVASTSSGAESTTGEDYTLGSLGAFSHTSGYTGFTKSFVEHGYIIGYVVFRQSHTYQQGTARLWTRKGRYDYYDPALAHIGEQPVYTYELWSNFAEENDASDYTDVFGYNEAWVQYRNHANQITGQMRSGVDNSLDVWHLGDVYASKPVLGKQFIEETPIYLDRCLTVTHETQDQFILDVKHNVSAIRCLPLKGVPSIL